MKIPKGYTEDQVIKLIQKIMDSLAPKNVFETYDIDDIKQEGFILALDGLASYDGSAPLENFLRNHLFNKLKTFRRDNSYRIDVRCTNCKSFNENCTKCQNRQRNEESKKNLLKPLDIDLIDTDNERAMYSYGTQDEVEVNELTERINKFLPVKDRKDYLRLKDGIPLPKSRKDELYLIINHILESGNV